MANQPQRRPPERSGERLEGSFDLLGQDMPGTSQPDRYPPGTWQGDGLGSTENASSASASTADDGARSLSDAAVETVRVAAGTVASQAKSLASNVAHELGTSTEAGVGKGADVIEGVAQAIRTAANELDQTSPTMARSIRTAAGQLEAFTNTIRGKSVGDLMNAAKDLARSRPTYFIAGAVIAGIAISRFIKSGKPAPVPTFGSTPPEDRQYGDTRRWE
jgi:hypothetical protein